MDLVICEAPLDNSFQKEKLELVNKGSLGRRRKPSRANLKLLLSPSISTTHPTTTTVTLQSKETKNKFPSKPRNNTLPSTPVAPVCNAPKATVNGYKEENLLRNCSSGLKIESTLPRTPTQTNHYVNDAQQFTIEAKLKRRKSDSGRSAVLIQTWERRTRCDSFSRQTKPKITARSNRFQNKENLGDTSTMPDFPKYSDNFKNNQWSKDDGFASSVRDDYSNGTMLYQKFHNGVNCQKSLQVHRTHPKSNEEPEWISLSRKLRAKFAEGHIEPNSTDSYLHEEPEGVKTVLEKQSISSSQQPIRSSHNTDGPPPQPKRQTFQQPQKIEKKIRIVVDTEEPRAQSGEPPWVQLSRKLCTKFIEEHIEYPNLPNHVPTRNTIDVLECNGDVRIIEKVGKPKGRKSKIRKDSEPEWVSLSKKLRAKFIESHIDDPDTISLDNQLNASDPEETSSESLSDSSPKLLPKKANNPSNNSECKSAIENKVITENRNLEKSNQGSKFNGLPFPEKECCWEYQEMEFDQESNSGNFQESEHFEENVSAGRISQSDFSLKNRYFPEDKAKKCVSDVQIFTNNMSFVETINCETLHNAECFNNDVLFPPHISEPEITSGSDKKYITVQFVAHPDINIPNNVDNGNDVPKRSPSKNGNCDFFNISTWEEAHYKSDDAESEQNTSPYPEVSLLQNFKSKSMDDICEVKGNCFKKSLPKEKKFSILCVPLSKENSISKSETILDQLEYKSIASNQCSNSKDFKNNFTSSREFKNEAFSKGKSPQSTQSKNFTVEAETRQCISNSKCKDAVYIDKNIRHDPKNNAIPTKHFKCNGVLPSKSKDLDIGMMNINEIDVRHPEATAKVEMNQSTKLKEAIIRNEYANINPLTDKIDPIEENSNNSSKLKNNSKSFQSVFETEENTKSVERFSQRYDYSTASKDPFEENTLFPESINGNLDSNYSNNDHVENVDLRMKSKSLCDISKHEEFVKSSRNSNLSKNEPKQGQNGIYQYSLAKSKASSTMNFQHFENESDIPLCAKLVSRQNGKCSNSSISSSSNRNASPCSESSHVYEDMFKETTSCPSDSETSSWTAVKNNSYYINGRSSSMNDLDCSDSCSLSVKCDYASSCSEQSTLQSRHSSCDSSSFYVNLRDYDSHMLEPSLNRKKDLNRRVGNGNSSKNMNSNPPTPESLRHLFTSPFNSTPNRANRLLNKLPSEPDIHYYSTSSATSSAFKHGFDPLPPKPKKTERSSSLKIKDIAHGIILTFRKLQNHSKNSHVSSTHYVDVSHLAETGVKVNNSDSNKSKSKKEHKENLRKHEKKGLWGFPFENGKTDSDSGCHLSTSEIQRAKARRSSSDLTGKKSNLQVLNQDTMLSENIIVPEKKKTKIGKKNSSSREKGKKTRSKSVEPKAIPTVSRKVQQMADGTLYLVTTVSGDTTLPGVYSDSPDTSSELSSHRPVKVNGESNC